VQLLFLVIAAAAILIAAAITFTVCAAIPALRRFAITAPAGALVIAPVLLVVGAQIANYNHHVFASENQGPFRFFPFWALELTALILSIALAYVVALVCRAVLEYIPPFLNAAFGLQPLLLLQTVLFVGALASAIVDFSFFAALVHGFSSQLLQVIIFGVVGILSTGICIQALFHLRDPQRYSPQPLPQWIKKILFGKTPPQEA
jgi:hypothetical protein